MSKYERLDNNYNTVDIQQQTTGEATSMMMRAAYHNHDNADDDDQDDDDDDYYNNYDDCIAGNNKILITNNHSNNGNNYNRIITGNNVNNNNNNSNNNNHNIILDPDESTMDVPLLNNNNNNHNYNDHDYEHACRCNQPGFAANLARKSTQDAKVKIIFAISLCGVFMIIEFFGGYLAGSLAIMADAAHLASDCISFVIGLVAIWLGGRPPDKKMSFGYKRMEVLGAIVSILGIWILTATLVLVAIERITNDYELDANTMMVISGIGILINIVMAYILHGGDSHHGHSHAHAHSHSHSHTLIHAHAATPQMDNALFVDGCSSDAINGNGLKHTNVGPCENEKNLNLRAAMIHVIGDLVQSIGVFLASIFIKFFPTAKFVDPLCALIFSVIVIMTTVALFRESICILMDAVPQDVSMENLERDLSHIDGVKSVHHLNVWNHTSNYSVMMVHLVTDLLSDSNAVLEKATSLAQSKKYNIKHSTIQIERLTS